MFKGLIVLVFIAYVQCQNLYPPTVELIQCTEAIWASDNNSFSAEELQYDLTGTTLFTSVNEDRFQTGSYPAFRDLLSKFSPMLGESDPDLTAEIELFLDVVLQTGPMQTAYNCLVNPDWGHVVDEADFRNQLRQYWFLKFSRSSGTADDSSGFEYVFQGQVSEDGSATTGFHGWVNTYDSEQLGDFVYGDSQADCQNDLVQINDFQYLGASKAATSMWIGRSPELQLALYSLCFLARRNQNCNFEVTIDGTTKDVTVVTRDMEVNGQDTIDYAYPECEGDTPPPGSTTTSPGGGDLSACTEAIWANDTNSFLESEIEYNLAGPILFTFVDETRFETGTYPLLRDLLNKYNHQIGEPDPPLDAEISAFLDAVVATGPMQVALQCLIDFGVVSNEAEFLTTLHEYWFEKYSRSSGLEQDSSGFEHTFQGETRENGNEMTGWHGWVRTYDTEQAGDFEYGSSQDDCGDGLVQINNYYYLGAEKSISSIWIGKSAELELALYTMCFAVNRNRDCDFTVDGGRPVTVVNYDISGTNQIGTAYPFC